MGQSERYEQLARISELARRLGYNDAQTKMLLGRWAGNLAELERRLLNKLDEKPERTPTGNRDNHEVEQPKQERGPKSWRMTTAPPAGVPADRSVPPDEGFLF